MTAPDLQTKLAEVLESARELLDPRRGRFYAMDPSGSYCLAASFGFGSRFGPAPTLEPGSPLLDFVTFHRKPAFVNSPRETGLLAAEMEHEQYTRALAAPVYLGSRMVGILELQEKNFAAPFTDEDVATLAEPLARLAEILRVHDRTAVAREPVDPEDAERLFVESTRPAPGRFPPPPPLFYAAPDPPPPAAPAHPAAEERPELTRRELAVLRGFVSTLLLDGDVESVAFSFWTPEKAQLFVGARRPLSEEAQESLWATAQAAALSAAPGLKPPSGRSVHPEFPLGRADGELTTFAGLQTSVVSCSRESALLFTILFGRPLPPEKTAALNETHRLVRSTVADARASGRYQSAYRSLINAFLEPGVRSYAQLKAHSLAVGLMSRRFARDLGLSAEQVEQITVAGLLHDIGLRELDLPYERIAGRRPLDLEELAAVRKHPVVGAALLQRIDFPYPVAPLVRHHHERFDGGGYPDRLSGEEIPLGSRIVGLVEAFDAMTASHSYRAAIPHDDALQIILQKGGSQFDPELALRFRDLVRRDPQFAFPRETRV